MNRISSQIGNEMNNPHKRDLSGGSHYSASSLPLPEYLCSSKNLRSVETFARQPRNSATRSNASISFNPGLLANSSNLNMLNSAPKSSNGAYLVSGYNPSNQFTYSRTYEAGWNHSNSQTASHSIESARGNTSSHRGNYTPIVIHSGTTSISKPGNAGPLSTYTPLVPTHSFTQSQKWTPAQLQNPSPIRPSPQVVSGVHRPQTSNPSPVPDNQSMSYQPNHNPSTAVNASNSIYGSPSAPSQPTLPQTASASAGNPTHPHFSEQPQQSQQPSEQQQQTHHQTQQSPPNRPAEHQQQVDWQALSRRLQEQLALKDSQLAQQQREIDNLRAENAELRLKAAASVTQGGKTDLNHTLRQHSASQDSDPHKFLELFAQLNDEKKRLDTLTAKIMHAAPAGMEGSVTRMSGEFLKDSFVAHKPAPESEGTSAKMYPSVDGVDSFSFKKKTSISDIKQTLSSNFPSLESDKISWYRQMKKQKDSVLEPSEGVPAATESKGTSESRIKNLVVDAARTEPDQAVPKAKKVVSKHKQAAVVAKKSRGKQTEKTKERGTVGEDEPEQDVGEPMDGRSPRSSKHTGVSESGDSTITRILAQYRGTAL